MAGFQKFPVPRSAHIDFWNYNKKWMGNSVALLAGVFFTWLSLNRYMHNRLVINPLSIENKHRRGKLYRPEPRSRLQTHHPVIVYINHFEFEYLRVSVFLCRSERSFGLL